MKKILVIGPCLKMGGMESASCNFANGLSRYGATVSYISIFKHEKFFRLDDNIVFYEPQNFNVNKLSFLKTIGYIRQTVKVVNPDSILVINKFYSAIVTLSLIFLKYKVFVSERSSPLFKWDFSFNIFNRLIFTLIPPAGVAAQTEFALEYQKKYYSKSKVALIPNVLRPICHPELIEKKTVILAVGRFNDDLKGFDRLIISFANAKIPYNWRLVFAGGNEEGGYLKKLAAENGVLDRIDFLGKVKNIDEIYSESSIFVIPSRSEGFPNALLEAMGFGLPCIAFNFYAGPQDLIVNNLNGIIVPDGDLKALSEQIERLVESPELRYDLGKAALSVNQTHSEGNIIKMLYKFLVNE
jgi:GalNAc-alpha-(1->4)-GalNAc-alpha-(1->3)-diNAcBac-PP-undecaprenol alpha-1,4-N-acetyl-D-galactosaminyltransferase